MDIKYFQNVWFSVAFTYPHFVHPISVDNQEFNAHKMPVSVILYAFGQWIMVLCSAFLQFTISQNFLTHMTCKVTMQIQSGNSAHTLQFFLSCQLRNGGNIQLTAKTDTILWLLRRVSVSSVIQYVQLLISLILCAVFIIWWKESAGSLGSILLSHMDS